MTATTMSSDLRHQEIFAEAAQWVVRLGAGSVTEAERAACRRWKAQSPVHEAAFNHAERMWRHVAQVGQTSHESEAAPSLTSVNRSRWLPIAACCAGLALASIFLFEEVHVLMTADYRTVAGERREVALPDNSRVTLNTGSAIALHFDNHERRVELLNGKRSSSRLPCKVPRRVRLSCRRAPAGLARWGHSFWFAGQAALKR